VLMDVLWKLFTRRKAVISDEDHKQFGENQMTIGRDEYYWVKYVEHVMDLLSDLCIGPDGHAIPQIQEFIAQDLMKVSEANSIRRRPEPECSDNVWTKTKITVEQHTQASIEIQRKGGYVGSGKGLAKLFAKKDEFTLLKLGTATFFDTFEDVLDQITEEGDEDSIQVPRVLWAQHRVQPPRFEGCRYGQDSFLMQQPGQKIHPSRFLYFSLVNLLGHLAADRNVENCAILHRAMPAGVARNQLIQKEVLRNAGQIFVPHHLYSEKKKRGEIKEARDAGDLSDLAALSSHLALVVHAFLGQPPFTDEAHRSAVISQVYLDSTRADDDDAVFEDVGATLALQLDDLRLLCHMCSWQFASLAELCRDMVQIAHRKTPPKQDFSNCMSHLVSILSITMSKLIGLGYFERFKRTATDSMIYEIGG